MKTISHWMFAQLVLTFIACLCLPSWTWAGGGGGSSSWTLLPSSSSSSSSSEIESCIVEKEKSNLPELPTGQGTNTSERSLLLFNPNNVKKKKSKNGGAETLICQIRTLHESLDLPTLIPQGLPPAQVLKLSLICNDVLLFESTLSTSTHLSPFGNLEELEIRNCKLRTLQNLGGLPRLQKLRVTTRNSQWPQRTLTLGGRAFQALPQLRDLDLGFNAIHLLPPDFLCTLPEGIQVLNLTHNLLTEFFISSSSLSSSSSSSLSSSSLISPSSLSSSFSYPSPSDSSVTSEAFPPSSYPSSPPSSSYPSSPPSSKEDPNKCGKLPSLKSLDLSHNALQRLWLPPEINPEILLLNHNLLQSLDGPPPEENEEEDGTSRRSPLDSATELLVLNLSSNLLSSLPSNLLLQTRNLRELSLRNNSLQALPPAFLLQTEYLQVLDLAFNSLGPSSGSSSSSSGSSTGSSSSTSWLNKVFSKLFRLVQLNLSHNNLDKVYPSFFGSLFTLQHLDLSHNVITALVDSPFAALTQLMTLNLAHNHLTTLEGGTLRNLISLRKLTLDYNDIHLIDAQALANSSQLQDLTLVRNSLEEIPETLRHLRHLRTLDLGENRISTMTNGSFVGLQDSLYGLRLAGNLLGEIPPGFCLHLNKLRALNLASNRLRRIHPSSFGDCPQLKVLRLDSNHLGEEEAEGSLEGNAPNYLFYQQLPNLLWLNVSGNGLEILDYSLLPPNLEWLDASSNALVRVLGGVERGGGGERGGGDDRGQEKSPHSSHKILRHLRVLDLSGNSLQEILPGTLPSGLEIIKLGHNQISRISPETFLRQPEDGPGLGGPRRLRRVELHWNLLRNLELKALRLALVVNHHHGNHHHHPPREEIPPGGTNTNNNPVVEFLLAGNPFLCDCDMEWLTRVNALSSYQSLMTIVDMDEIQCELPFSRSPPIPLPSPGASEEIRRKETRALTEMKPSDFLCPYTSHCFALCHCCEFDFCDCHMTCPDSCECFHDDTWTANVVNCGGRNLTGVPGSLPMDSTTVYLDGNRDMGALRRHGFIGRKNLKVLYLNGSGIEMIGNKSFNGLHSLQVLHLDHNALTQLQGYEFEGLARLKVLKLSWNRISSISNDTFLNLKALEVLDLGQNLLVTFKLWQLNLNRNLGRVILRGNPFPCEDCEFLLMLQKWLRNARRKLPGRNMGLSGENNDLKWEDDLKWEEDDRLQCRWNRTGQVGFLIKDFNVSACAERHYLYYDSEVGDWQFLNNEAGIFNFPASYTIWYIIFGLLLLFLLLGLVVLVLVYGNGLKLLLFKMVHHYPLQKEEPEGEEPPGGTNPTHDIMILYSRSDTDFIRRISHTLEEKSYKILLVPDLMTSNSVGLNGLQPRSVLVIISKNFFLDFNTEPEFRQVIANNVFGFQSSQGPFEEKVKRRKKGKKNNVIIVSKDKISKGKSPEFFHFETVVGKGRLIVFESRKCFWEKLTYLLGAPSGSYGPSSAPSSSSSSSASSGRKHGLQVHHSDTGYGSSSSPSNSLVYKSTFHQAFLMEEASIGSSAGPGGDGGGGNSNIRRGNGHIGGPNCHIGGQNCHINGQNLHPGSQNGHSGSQNGHIDGQNCHIGGQNGQNGHIGSQNGHIDGQNCHIGSQNGHIGDQNCHIGCQNGQNGHIDEQNVRIGGSNGPFGGQNSHLGGVNSHLREGNPVEGGLYGFPGSPPPKVPSQTASPGSFLKTYSNPLTSAPSPSPLTTSLSRLKYPDNSNYYCHTGTSSSLSSHPPRQGVHPPHPPQEFRGGELQRGEFSSTASIPHSPRNFQYNHHHSQPQVAPPGYYYHEGINNGISSSSSSSSQDFINTPGGPPPHPPPPPPPPGKYNEGTLQKFNNEPSPNRTMYGGRTSGRGPHSPHHDPRLFPGGKSRAEDLPVPPGGGSIYRNLPLKEATKYGDGTIISSLLRSGGGPPTDGRHLRISSSSPSNVTDSTTLEENQEGYSSSSLSGSSDNFYHEPHGIDGGNTSPRNFGSSVNRKILEGIGREGVEEEDNEEEDEEEHMYFTLDPASPSTPPPAPAPSGGKPPIMPRHVDSNCNKGGGGRLQMQTFMV